MKLQKDNRGRIAWSPEMVQEIEAAAKKNGVSVMKESKSRGINPAMFYSAKLRFQKSKRPKKNKAVKSGNFLDIALDTPKPSGRLVLIHGSVDDVTKVLGALWQ